MSLVFSRRSGPTRSASSAAFARTSGSGLSFIFAYLSLTSSDIVARIAPKLPKSNAGPSSHPSGTVDTLFSNRLYDLVGFLAYLRIRMLQHLNQPVYHRVIRPFHLAIPDRPQSGVLAIRH